MDILYKPLTSPYCIFSGGIPIFCWLNPDSCHLNLQLHSLTPNVCWLTLTNFFWWFLLKWSTTLIYGHLSMEMMFKPLDSSVPHCWTLPNVGEESLASPRRQEKLIRRRTKPFGSAMQQRTDGIDGEVFPDGLSSNSWSWRYTIQPTKVGIEWDINRIRRFTAIAI